MPRKNVTAYDLLISCPGDVSKYVDIVKECIESFNITIGRLNNAEIVGQHWSTSSYAQSGDRPQEILNKQFVRDCDAAIAIFWTRFGTPTDKYGSGTEEEIEEMLFDGKQVFMYFVTEPVDMNSVDLEQYKKVQDFKARYEGKGTYGTYFTVSNVEDLRRLFTNHLAMHFLPIIMGEESSAITAPKSKLNIQDYNDSEEGCVAIMYSNYLNGEFIVTMEKDIVDKIEKTKQVVLQPRIRDENFAGEKKLEAEEKKTEIGQSPGARVTLKDMDFLKSLTSDVDIKDEWKKSILSFATRLGVDIEDSFWNVGNLTISKPLLNPMLGGVGSTLNGSEEEKLHYSEIEEIHWRIKELNEYREFLGIIDSYKMIELVLANDGTTFDEDIDVKLHLGKGNIVKKEDLPIPGILTIEDFIEMQFVESVFKIRETDDVSEYVGYPIMPQRISYRINSSFNQPSTEEYEENKQKYEDSINQIFCYDIFENQNEDILVIHLEYLKHNTKIAFPSVLVFENVPNTIPYEIYSKHSSEVTHGVLQMVE